MTPVLLSAAELLGKSGVHKAVYVKTHNNRLICGRVVDKRRNVPVCTNYKRRIGNVRQVPWRVYIRTKKKSNNGIGL